MLDVMKDRSMPFFLNLNPLSLFLSFLFEKRITIILPHFTPFKALSFWKNLSMIT